MPPTCRAFFSPLVRVAQNQDHAISTKKHLVDEPILVDSPTCLAGLVALGLLRPHFLHVLENHVAVSVKGLDASQQLMVVAAVD